MVLYDPPMPQISRSEIEQTTRDALEVHGASAEVATSVAHAVGVAEGNGNKICGLYYVESYCKQLESGRVDGDVEPTVTTDRPGAVRVDAQLGFAQPAFAAGFSAAVEAARTNGICGYSIEQSHTCTAVGYFTEQFAREGLLAIGTTNATAVVSPPGGSDRLLGTNPIAMAVPDGQGGVAFQFDFSTSAIALGKITMAAAAGESIPEGWAVDADGNPTTDPKAALAGSLLSAGGHKGFGIGLLVELLAAGLTGGRLSTELAPLKAADGPPHALGQFYVVIDPGAYSGDGFYERLAALAANVEAQEGARLPGSAKTTADQVDVDATAWESVCALANRP